MTFVQNYQGLFKKRVVVTFHYVFQLNIVLLCIVLYCRLYSIADCIVLHCSVLHCIVLHCR